MAELFQPLQIGGLSIESWQVEASARLISCVFVGFLIGLEREFHGRAAGLRTHILVCVGCCLVMLVSLHIPRLYEGISPDNTVIRLDPARLAYGVLTGIGFLGAGVILKLKEGGTAIHGLTTAASLWCTAAFGLGLGVGLYYLVAFAAVLVIMSLWAGRFFSIMRTHEYRTLVITSVYDRSNFDGLERSFHASRLKVQKMAVERESGLSKVKYTLRIIGREATATQAVQVALAEHHDWIDKFEIE